MADLNFDKIVNFGREEVKKEYDFIGENNTPFFNWLMSRRKMRLTQFGYRIPIQTQEQGGHGFFNRSNVNFNTPIPFDGDSMRVYPTWYALPVEVDGASLRDMKSGDENVFVKYASQMKMGTKAAKKRLNQIFQGDGTGALAVSNTTGGTGNVNLHTLASSSQLEAGTKGSVRLVKNNVYQSINPSTEAVRGTFTVTAINSKSQVAANFSSGTTAAGDPIVDVGSYKNAPQGTRSLLAQTGLLQNVNRADYAEMKTPRVNGGDLPVSPFMINNAKDLINVAANDQEESVGRLIKTTHGQYSALAAQGYGFRQYGASESTRGVPRKYIDQEGDTWLIEADGAEDRIELLDQASYVLGEQKEFGLYNEDGNDLRMSAGSNGVGADKFFWAIGWGGNLIKDGLPRVDAYIDRIGQTDIIQQTSL